MPNNLIVSFANKTDKSVSQIEKYWNDIKQGLIGSGHKESEDNFYALLVSILKKKLKLKTPITDN